MMKSAIQCALISIGITLFISWTHAVCWEMGWTSYRPVEYRDIDAGFDERERWFGWPFAAIGYVAVGQPYLVPSPQDPILRMRWTRQGAFVVVIGARSVPVGYFVRWPYAVGDCVIWCIVLLSITHVRRWKVRDRKGLCVDCGYPIVGLVSRRCPECGKMRIGR